MFCFKNKEHLLVFLKGVSPEIGSGSQGVVYYDKRKGCVYKIFHQFFDEYDPDEHIVYDKKEINKFANIDNKTFVWSTDVICVGDEIVGTVSKYARGKNLYKIDPLSINLDKFVEGIGKVQKDIDIISRNGVLTYDVMYNVLYENGKFCIVDHDEYNYSDENSYELVRKNNDNFNYEIMLFLIDNYFDEFISNYRYLRSMYSEKGVNIIHFIMEFRRELSEYVGEDIKYLRSAKCRLNKKDLENPKYERILAKR